MTIRRESSGTGRSVVESIAWFLVERKVARSDLVRLLIEDQETCEFDSIVSARFLGPVSSTP